MLASVLNGHDAVFVDCNPLAAAVTRSEVDVVGVDDLARCSEALCEQVTSTDVADDGFWDQFAVGTHDELASWFAPRVLAKLGGCCAGAAVVLGVNVALQVSGLTAQTSGQAESPAARR